MNSTIRRVAAALLTAALALGPAVYHDMRTPAQTIPYGEVFSPPHTAPDTYFDM